MKRFTLVHEGNESGWQTAYYAIYIATRLGADLDVCLVLPPETEVDADQLKSEVRLASRAAGVVADTVLPPFQSIAEFVAAAPAGDGLFLSRMLVPDESAAMDFLDACLGPLWIVSAGIDTNALVAVSHEPVADAALVAYGYRLAQRLQQPLAGLVAREQFPAAARIELPVAWEALGDPYPESAAAALDRMGADLVFLPFALAGLMAYLPFNLVLFPPLAPEPQSNSTETP